MLLRCQLLKKVYSKSGARSANPGKAVAAGIVMPVLAPHAAPLAVHKKHAAMNAIRLLNSMIVQQNLAMPNLFMRLGELHNFVKRPALRLSRRYVTISLLLIPTIFVTPAITKRHFEQRST